MIVFFVSGILFEIMFFTFWYSDPNIDTYMVAKCHLEINNLRNIIIYKSMHCATEFSKAKRFQL